MHRSALRLRWIVTGFLIVVITGCSTNSINPAEVGDIALSPSLTERVTTSGAAHCTWGMWQFTADPVAKTLDCVRLRAANFHLNALPFLEPPPFVNLTLESLEFNDDIIETDIGLRHPFLGLTKFTGFDVCGILITNGGITGFSDPDLRMAGEGDTYLMNPDGYTRWWNPTEFPVNPGTILGYTDGLLGAPDSIAGYTATLNGYKYFADYLTPDDPVSAVDTGSRGVFSAGQKNMRHYEIEMGDGFVFNYAVDANWAFPTGGAPYDVPDDFPPKANRSEAWNISVTEVENSLAYEESAGAGHLLLEINVFDWFNAGLNEVVAESLDGIAPVTSSTPVGGGEGYSTYELDLPGDNLTASGEIDLLITIRSEKTGYQGLLPGETICAYFIHATEVGSEIVETLKWVYNDEIPAYDNDLMSLSPSICERLTGEIDIGFSRVEFSSGAGHKGRCYALSSSDNGESMAYDWKAGPYHAGQTIKCLKASQGPLGNTVFIYQVWLNEGADPYNHASTARDPACTFGENEGLYVPWTNHAQEVIWAADDKIVCLGDGGQHIQYKKGTHANSLFYNHGWSWLQAPEFEIVPYLSRLSKVRSICKDDGGAIYFAYFGDIHTTWIKLAVNADGLGTDWEIGTYITEGLTDEYSTRIEPSLTIDPDGKFHSTFIGEIDPMYSVLYTSTGDSGVWPGYVPIYTNPDSVISEVTVDSFKFEDKTVVVIGFQMDGDIRFLSSLDGGLTFSEPVLISDGTGNSSEPDIYADSLGYVHFAWSQFKEDLEGYIDDYDIQYRRAYLDYY